MVSRGGPIALVFPGQGSQVVGMGKSVHEAFSAAREVFARADAALGFALSRVCFDGPPEALTLTANTQPAILTTSLALVAALRSASPGLFEPGVIACVAGHSLGEYSALVAAGALAIDDAVRTVRRRGEYMQEAVPVGQGAMLAILGTPLERVFALCREAAHGEVLSPANLNAPDQTVVAGTSSAVDRLAELAKVSGIRKVVRLAVSAPFHCALMAPAQQRLALDLGRLPMQDARFPVLPNVTATATTHATDLRQALVDQVTAPVRWVETIRAMAAQGVRTLVEVGPGRVLTGLARRIAPELSLLNVEDASSVSGAGEAIMARTEDGA